MNKYITTSAQGNFEYYEQGSDRGYTTEASIPDPILPNDYPPDNCELVGTAALKEDSNIFTLFWTWKVNI